VQGIVLTRPDFAGDIDEKAYIERVPPDAFCKGMFFHDVLAMVRRLAPASEGQLKASMRPRYLPFKDYPLREHMELTARAARLVYPNRPTREGLRMLGWLAFPAFAESMVGRVVFGVLGNDLDDTFRVGPRSFELSMTRGRARAERIADRHWRYEFHDIFGYLDCYYVGVMEGPIRRLGFSPDVRLALTTPSSGMMEIQWV
jgi:uncharacterized protein (TIGR02265 family)